ncbi:putative ABC transport system permease protein [Sporobacter termitidis DSM 10068]|uniref:Putative ABC transport system permease protein n=1 Tax=Sporobacter termitidis DSM 10068 TaxID=1123282 RepID=A0A1M5XTR9_9FIRM|nr:ABC transporter permease [Sporobacter termitidis]SHI03197.1 putative ABC transport system permease protein [Sporobacter termitidis DSM 10068]
MFWRMVKGAFLRQKGKMLMIAFTIALGASLAAAMLNVMLDVGDKVNQELKTYGANINVLPKGASLLDDLYGVGEGSGVSDQYLKESELGNMKTIFWAHNIVDFTPYLNAKVKLAAQDSEVKLVGTWFSHHLDLPTGESLDTGMESMKSWWDVSGQWLADQDENSAMVGSLVAGRNNIQVGDTITLESGERTKKLTVKGIFNAGSDEDEQIYVPLPTAQELADRAGLVSSVEVSALTTPDNELARRAAQNPNSLSIKEQETWYCTAYVSSICYQIEEVITDAVAKPIRQVAESEGAILEKTQLLMLLITILSLVGSALGISNLVTASVMERSREIGLLKAVGARNSPITWLVLTEILITAVVGGVVGYFAGLGFAQIIGHSVFGSAIDIKPMVIPLVAVLVALVTLAGSIPSIRLLLSLRPAEVLHGR